VNHRLRRFLLIFLASVLGLSLLLLLSGTLVLRGSLPRLSGHTELSGLEGSVSIARDDLGVPDIKAQSRQDAARALGYLHAQDRFFQMDLQRRSAAGEMAALLGSSQLKTDRNTRRHRFRMRAGQVLQNMDSQESGILEAYTAGVNAGLDDLKSRPFEYLVLRQKPQPWRPADSILTLYAMFLDLSFSTASTEEAWANVRDNLPPALVEFLLPRGNLWEAPLQSQSHPGVILPDSFQCDIRTWAVAGSSLEEFRASKQQSPRHDSAGSNNWAVAGNLTGHGGALLANDMHLGHMLPNIWYRARISWQDDNEIRSLVGVTLPGLPMLVAGSNGHVAWGFTNSYGDWADLIILELDPDNPNRYRTENGWEEISQAAEIIFQEGAKPDTLWVEETIWGPIWSTDTRGNRLVLRWTAHDRETVYSGLRTMETVNNVDEVVARAGSVGMPQQNLVCADSSGRIAWTIAGFIPRRVGWDGRLPVSWASGANRWDGYYSCAEQPAIVDPAEGRLWTANSRVSAGHDFEIIGDGGYGLGPRARQIRDDLRALQKPVEKDMLQVQLDDRAVFLAQWRELVIKTLESHPGEAGSLRDQFLREVKDHWQGRAIPESVSYRLVRSFTYECIDGVYDVLTRACEDAGSDFSSYWLPYRHAVTWELLNSQPAHLLPDIWTDWDDFILKAVDRTMVSATGDGALLSDYTWGNRNVVEVVHPFTWLAPWLSRWLAAPAEPLPGDSYMPRVQHRRSGASERLVVSPGREKDGILHMPGGQSGHPMSPFFLAGHKAWTEGLATSLLPGPEKYLLVLEPAKDGN